MADALASGASNRKVVRVQVPPRPPASADWAVKVLRDLGGILAIKRLCFTTRQFELLVLTHQGGKAASENVLNVFAMILDWTISEMCPA